jgi:hypothetical protein
MSRTPWWVSALVHAALLLAVASRCTPCCGWSRWRCRPSGTPSFRAIPLPEAASLVNFREVLGATNRAGQWVFGRQLFNSIVVSVSHRGGERRAGHPRGVRARALRFVGKERAFGCCSRRRCSPAWRRRCRCT